jgi:hypothetical protein
MTENLDLVRSIFAAWERGDYGSAEWAHPDVEYVYADGPSPGRWVGGLEGVRDFLGAWDNLRVEVDEYRSSTRSACLCSPVSADAESEAEWTSRRWVPTERTSSTSAAAR